MPQLDRGRSARTDNQPGSIKMRETQKNDGSVVLNKLSAIPESTEDCPTL